MIPNANVHVSVMGTEAQQRTSPAGLEHATGYVRALLARKLRTRQCPHIRFSLDDSIKRATETIRKVDEAMEEIRSSNAPADVAAGDPGMSADAGGDA